MAHMHSVYDNDTHFSINPITRALRNEASGKTSVIQYDHNSERFTFEIPRTIEGHDMSKCNVIRVHYINIDAKTKAQVTGVYEVDDMQVSPNDDDVVICSWLISRNATQLVGSLHFVLCFSCVTNGIVEYAWNTAMYTGISVGTGIDNGEEVATHYPDVLDQWREELMSILEHGVHPIARSNSQNGEMYFAHGGSLPTVDANKISQLVFVPDLDNTTNEPTLSINNGESFPIRMRVSQDNSDPTVPVGMLVGGTPYVLTFAGDCWLVDSMVDAPSGSVPDSDPDNIYLSAFGNALINLIDMEFTGLPYSDAVANNGAGAMGFMSIQRTQEEEENPGHVKIPSVGMMERHVEDMLGDYPTTEDVQDHINNASMKAKYNVSASAADNVYLTIVSNGDLTYTAKLSGEGSTRDFTKSEAKPWDAHINKIAAIEIGSGVTSIGANLFREHQEVRALRFENIANIRHLGARAFMRCRFGGEFNFSGLEDTTLDTAFYGCSEMEGLSVPSTITTVAPFALTACFSLKYVRGIDNVTTIGDGAFAWCTSLVSTDISPAKVESVAVAAFSSCPALNGTSAAEWVKLNNVPLLTVPALNWTDETLAEIRAVKLPNAPAREMFPDDQTNYPDMPYCMELNGSQRYMGSGGCSAITFYNIYNHFNRAQFINAEEWWDGVILAQDPDIATTYYYPNTGMESVETSVFLRMLNLMGWEAYWTDDLDVDISTDGNEFDRQDANFQRIAGYYTPAQFKQFIAEALSKGIPVAVGCKPDGASGHMVAVIGSDPETDQLIVCDSMHFSGKQGRIYKVAFENLIQNDGWASLSAWMPIGYVADEPTDPESGDIPQGDSSDKPMTLIYEKTFEQVNSISDILEGGKDYNRIIFELYIFDRTTALTIQNFSLFSNKSLIYYHAYGGNTFSEAYPSNYTVGEIERLNGLEYSKVYYGGIAQRPNYVGGMALSSNGVQIGVKTDLNNSEKISLVFNGEETANVRLKIWGC